MDFLENEATAAVVELPEEYHPFAPTMKPLHIVASYGLTNLIDVCLDKGHGIDIATSGGHTPLWFALKANHEQTARALLQRGAQDYVIHDMCHEYQYSMLGLAIQRGNTEAIGLLLKGGSKVNPTVTNELGNKLCLLTPLLEAAARGHLGIVNLLLEHGVDANLACKDKDDNQGINVCEWKPPLQVAAEKEDTETSRTLLELGANPDSQYISKQTTTNPLYSLLGSTPISLASSNGREAV
ncbi:ankyrin repeat-containing domain protein [Trichoderma sp. SZMC 28014]